MARVDQLRKRSAVMNFRVTPQVARYVKRLAAEVGETVSDYCREALKLRLEVHQTYNDLAETLGFADPQVLIWHAVKEYAMRHHPERVEVPAMPEPTLDGEVTIPS